MVITLTEKLHTSELKIQDLQEETFQNNTIFGNVGGVTKPTNVYKYIRNILPQFRSG